MLIKKACSPLYSHYIDTEVHGSIAQLASFKQSACNKVLGLFYLICILMYSI